VPSAYITGEAWLGDFCFRVDRRVLIPRSFIAELLRDDEVQPAPWLAEPDTVDRVLDLCTGSGCLAIVAAHVFLNATVDAADISDDALAVATLNIADYGLESRIELLHGDLFAPLAGRRYDRILCNPPYVDALAMSELPDEFRHEPELALAAGEDGMDLVRRILRDAVDHLTPDGWLLVEVGERRETVEALWPALEMSWPLTSAGDGVHCYHPDGTLIGKIKVPEAVANVCFGEFYRNRLFIAAPHRFMPAICRCAGPKPIEQSQASSKLW
jgi:ribosomal protein L3 glutamine methyltransferase